MNQTVQKLPRIEVVDALRGFAVMCILLLPMWNILSFPFILLIRLRG